MKRPRSRCRPRPSAAARRRRPLVAVVLVLRGGALRALGRTRPAGRQGAGLPAGPPRRPAGRRRHRPRLGLRAGRRRGDAGRRRPPPRRHRRRAGRAWPRGARRRAPSRSIGRERPYVAGDADRLVADPGRLVVAQRPRRRRGGHGERPGAARRARPAPLAAPGQRGRRGVALLRRRAPPHRRDRRLGGRHAVRGRHPRRPPRGGALLAARSGGVRAIEARPPVQLSRVLRDAERQRTADDRATSSPRSCVGDVGDRDRGGHVGVGQHQRQAGVAALAQARVDRDPAEQVGAERLGELLAAARRRTRRGSSRSRGR